MKNESPIRQAEIRKVLAVALLFNLLAWAVKFLWGHWTGFTSMQADSLHSLLDACSSVLGFLGVFMAARPPDDGHPYGYGRFEAMAAAGIAVLIFGGCFEIVMESAARFQSRAQPYATPTAFVIMLVLMTANRFLSRWEGRMGRQFHSEVVSADALHTKSDFYASLSVIISLIGSKIGYYWIDPVAALAIAGLIGYAGAKILKDSVRVLTDSAQVDPKAVEAFVLGMEGILACHAVRTRGSRHQVYMDLHIHTAPEIPLADAHQLAHRVESAIMGRFCEVSEVVVHLEPHLPDLEND